MLFGMAIPNLIAVYLLLPELRRDLEAYEKGRTHARPVAGASL
jgi:Na+/alanine symporter